MAKAKKLGKPKRNRSNFAKRLKLVKSNIYNKENYGKK